jgi:hypothetical protein
MPEETKNQYKLENLVVLQYSPNACYTNVVDASSRECTPYEELTLDLENGKWTYHLSHRVKRTKEIGQSGYVPSGERGGVIGVYDRTNIKHLNSMVFASNDAVRERHPIDD